MVSQTPKREGRKARKQRLMLQFCRAFLSYPNVADAAKACGVSARTATVWLKSDEFKDVYVESRATDRKAMHALVRAALPGAIETLAELSRDKTAAATARCNASRALVEADSQMTQDFEFEQRLQTLEKLAQTGDV